ISRTVGRGGAAAPGRTSRDPGPPFSYSESVQQVHRAGESFVRKADPLLLAGSAQPIDLQPVAHGHEPVTARRLLLDAYHLRTLELHDVVTVHADEVLVIRRRAEEVFVALEPLPEIVLLHQPAPDQDLDRPIDGRLPYPLAIAAERQLDVF